MRFLIVLGTAALSAAALSAPASAEDWSGPPPGGFHRGDHHDGDGRDTRRHRHRGNDGFFIQYDAGAWALYNNRSWDSDSFNDWWHDRPDRAYPRWVMEQRRSGTCEPDRMWWSGSGWHC